MSVSTDTVVQLRELLDGRADEGERFVRPDLAQTDTTKAFREAMQKAEEIESKFSEFNVRAEDLAVGLSDDGVPFLSVRNEHQLWFSPWAFSQMTDRIGMGATQYMKKCLRQEEYDLVPLNMNRWLNRNPDKPLFLRVYEGNKLKAVLSDRYSVLNHSDVLRGLEKTVSIGGQFQLQSYSVTPDNMQIRVVDPGEIIVDRASPYDGDGSTAGMVIRNGLTGMSSVSIEFMLYTLVCTNGLIVVGDRGSAYSRKHYAVGREKFIEEIAATFNEFPEYATAARGGVERARQARLDIEKRVEIFDLIKKELSCGEEMVEKIKDVMDNSWERTAWGLSGAITEVAQELSVERQYVYERFAGSLMNRLAA